MAAGRDAVQQGAFRRATEQYQYDTATAHAIVEACLVAYETWQETLVEIGATAEKFLAEDAARDGADATTTAEPSLPTTPPPSARRNGRPAAAEVDVETPSTPES